MPHVFLDHYAPNISNTGLHSEHGACQFSQTGWQETPGNLTVPPQCQIYSLTGICYCIQHLFLFWGFFFALLFLGGLFFVFYFGSGDQIQVLMLVQHFTVWSVSSVLSFYLIVPILHRCLTEASHHSYCVPLMLMRLNNVSVVIGHLSIPLPFRGFSISCSTSCLSLRMHESLHAVVIHCNYLPRYSLFSHTFGSILERKVLILI